MEENSCKSPYFKLLLAITDTKAQRLRRALAKPVSQPRQEVALDQIQLLCPDGIRTAHRQLAPAFGYRRSNRGDALADDRGPNRLHSGKRRLRRCSLER
ncbi:MAG TPA: hypothetical protein VG898_12260 [Solirubrobacterales bacterium]|nr:hypothetical protein [Solirubrobacterales bacterium]